MGLSDEQKLRLEIRYEDWGIDEVRRELERVDRTRFVHSDITEFAQSWIKAKEASIRRKKFIIDILAVFIAIQIGLAAAVFLLF